MWRQLVIAAVVLAALAPSVVRGDIILTLDGKNPTDSIIFADYSCRFVVAADGNSPFEPNDISIQAVNGTLDANEPNGGYYFQFAAEGEAWVNIFTATDMVIDGNSVPADTLIYQLWLCYNSEWQIYVAFGIGLSELLLPPEEGQGGEPDNLPEGTSEGPCIETEPATSLGEGGDSPRGTSGYDPYWDLNADNRIDFVDFAIFGAEWGTTYNIYDLAAFSAGFSSGDCCADMNVADVNVWQYVDFTGIGSCGPYDCWFEGEDESDPCNDACGNRALVRCEETSEFGDECAYNYWFNSRRVGLCVYTCGLNAFQVQKNRGGCRNVVVRQRTQDRLDIYGCDQGTSGKYDWQVVAYSAITGNRVGYCRQSSSDPGPNDYWNADQGQQSQCEMQWW